VKTIDLRRQQVTLDELLQSVGGDSVRVTSKDGAEFILEAADAFEREAAELGRSAKFLAFLAERSAESGRITLADVETRLAGAKPTTTDTDAIATPEDDPISPPSVPDA
jgi:hypothetical protein